MLIDSTRTFKVTARTPLGDEDFFISLIKCNEVIGGRIWNDKGEISFSDSIEENNFLIWNIPIETPFETILKFAVAVSEENRMSGRVVIGDYGYVNFQGFGE
jgi:hypothetical protein